MAAASTLVGLPLSKAPLFARDRHDLRTVLSAQAAEAEELRQRLTVGQRKCASLRAKLRDSIGEVSIAAEATASATERLATHAGRQGLVIAAGVERCSAERAAIEDELQRMERLLFERDQQISKLRQAAQELENCRLQGELEITGLVVAHEATNSDVQTLGAGITELQQRLGGNATHRALRPVHTAVLAEGKELSGKQVEHAALKRRAEVVAAELRRLDAEASSFRDRIGAFERQLRQSQAEMEMYDQNLVKEAEHRRMQCDSLRHNLLHQQRDSISIDQRTALQPQCSAEADNVRQQTTEMIRTIQRLAPRLHAQGRHVLSPEVPGDPIDIIHAYLRGCRGSIEDPVPVLLWRLAPGEYLIGNARVAVTDMHGQLAVRDMGGKFTPLRDFVRLQMQHRFADVINV